MVTRDLLADEPDCVDLDLEVLDLGVVRLWDINCTSANDRMSSACQLANRDPLCARYVELAPPLFAVRQLPFCSNLMVVDDIDQELPRVHSMHPGSRIGNVEISKGASRNDQKVGSDACGMSNDGCPGNGWSIISSAPTNSQLAGVLAGFVFTGVIILFSRPGPKNTQALGLFSATFVVLAFDSYLFSLVSGGNTDRVCSRVWSEAMAASGMLGAGGVGLIGSIAWLLAHYNNDAADEGDRRQAGPNATIALDRLSRAMLFGVTVAVMLLLAATSSDYLDIIFDRHKPLWLTWITLCSPVVVGLVTWVLVLRQARRRRRKGASVNPDDEPTHTLSHVAFGMLAYAVVGPVFAGVLTNLPEAVWTTPAITIAIVTLFVGLIVPAVLLVTVVLSAPPVSPPPAASEEPGVSSDGKNPEPVSARPASISVPDRHPTGSDHDDAR